MSIEAMKLALEALENLQGLCSEESGFIEQVTIWTPEAITALRLAIEQAEKQEPVAHLIEYNNGEKELRFQSNGWGDKVIPLYTAPPAAQRQPLTEQEIAEIMDYGQYDRRVPEYAKNFVRAIEAAHGIGGEHD